MPAPQAQSRKVVTRALTVGPESYYRGTRQCGDRHRLKIWTAKFKQVWMNGQTAIREGLCGLDRLLIVQDATVVPAFGNDACGSLRVRGQQEMWYEWWPPILDGEPNSQPPEGWPFEEESVPWWLRWLEGSTRTVPACGWRMLRLRPIDIVVPAQSFSGQPRTE